MEAKKLKRMLELKKRIEQARKGAVVEARQELDQAQLKLITAQGEQRARLDQLADSAEVSATELADRARFVVLAGEQVCAAREIVAVRDHSFAQCEQERVLATRDVRTFEILNERARSEQRAAEKSLEQRNADDMASARRSSS